MNISVCLVVIFRYVREGRFRIEERTLTAFQWLYSPQQHRIVSRADLGSPSRYRGRGRHGTAPWGRSSPGSQPLLLGPCKCLRLGPASEQGSGSGGCRQEPGVSASLVRSSRKGKVLTASPGSLLQIPCLWSGTSPAEDLLNACSTTLSSKTHCKYGLEPHCGAVPWLFLPLMHMHCCRFRSECLVIKCHYHKSLVGLQKPIVQRLFPCLLRVENTQKTKSKPTSLCGYVAESFSLCIAADLLREPLRASKHLPAQSSPRGAKGAGGAPGLHSQGPSQGWALPRQGTGCRRCLAPSTSCCCQLAPEVVIPLLCEKNPNYHAGY